ncbi:MAG: iron-containing alcohol dehydrogenase, partial [Clostridia bacterium]
KHVCTRAVEDVIEANTFLSGIGFESGGLAGAHAIHNGFTVLPACHAFYHGEKVAFGTLTQLMLENVPTEELCEVYDFCETVGLPTTLADIGLDSVSDDDIMAVANATCAPGESIYNMPMEITPDKIFAAIKAADAFGEYYKEL